MPYRVVKLKRGWKVQDDDGHFYSKKPLTKTMATRQLRALYASETVRGRGFASYVDETGHHIILTGNGFFSDIWASIKSTGNSVLHTLLPKSLTAVAQAVNSGVRSNYPPRVRDILARYGAAQVVMLEIYRTPIESYINSALNIITLGKWNESRNRFNFDKLYHLSLVATLSTLTGDKAFLKIEKNEVINIVPIDSPPAGDSITVPVPCCITLQAMLDKAHALAGQAFFFYDAFNNNCQIFINNILAANHLATPETTAFIMQDVRELLADLPAYTAPFASTLTGIAGFFDKLMYGEGMEGGGAFTDYLSALLDQTGTAADITKDVPGLGTATNVLRGVDALNQLRKATGAVLKNTMEQHAPGISQNPVLKNNFGFLGFGAGANDINPATGFTPNQQYFIDRERTEARKEARREQFRQYNAKFQHTVEMQPVFGEVHRDDIIGTFDANPDDKNAYLETLLGNWKQSGKKDFKDYYYGDNQAISFNPTNPTTPRSASGSPALSAQKSDITGAWTITYADGSKETTRARNLNKYDATSSDVGEQYEKVLGVADMNAKRIQEEYERQRASMSATDRFFEGLNDALIGIADIFTTILPINPIVGAVYDTFRPETSSERQTRVVSEYKQRYIDEGIDNSKTVGEAENDLFRGRLSGLAQYDSGIQQRLANEAQYGTAMSQALQGTGNTQARVRPMTEEDAWLYRYMYQTPPFRRLTRHQQMEMVQYARQLLMNARLEALREEAEEDDETLSTVSDASSQSAESLHGGSSSPQRLFARQLRKVGLSAEDYLRRARKSANATGYDGRALEFSDDDEHKLMIYDDEGKPVRFGRVGYGDHIIWSHEEAMGRVRPGFAAQKRRTFRKSHSAIKGDWKSNRFSPNALALAINW